MMPGQVETLRDLVACLGEDGSKHDHAIVVIHEAIRLGINTGPEIIATLTELGFNRNMRALCSTPGPGLSRPATTGTRTATAGITADFHSPRAPCGVRGGFISSAYFFTCFANPVRRIIPTVPLNEGKLTFSASLVPNGQLVVHSGRLSLPHEEWLQNLRI